MTLKIFRELSKDPNTHRTLESVTDGWEQKHPECKPRKRILQVKQWEFLLRFVTLAWLSICIFYLPKIWVQESTGSGPFVVLTDRVTGGHLIATSLIMSDALWAFLMGSFILISFGNWANRKIDRLLECPDFQGFLTKLDVLEQVLGLQKHGGYHGGRLDHGQLQGLSDSTLMALAAGKTALRGEPVVNEIAAIYGFAFHILAEFNLIKGPGPDKLGKRLGWQFVKSEQST